MVRRPLSSQNRFVQPGLFPLPPKGDRSLEGLTFAGTAHCVSELGKLVRTRLQINMADAGQHIDQPVRAEQAKVAEYAPDTNYERFNRARTTAENTYRKFGQQLCVDCLGADGCPFRAVGPDGEERAVNSAEKFGRYAENLSDSARKNIKQGKITPRTREISTQALHRI